MLATVVGLVTGHQTGLEPGRGIVYRSYSLHHHQHFFASVLHLARFVLKPSVSSMNISLHIYNVLCITHTYPCHINILALVTTLSRFQ
jgi:hypothetical protein